VVLVVPVAVVMVLGVLGVLVVVEGSAKEVRWRSRVLRAVLEVMAEVLTLPRKTVRPALSRSEGVIGFVRDSCWGIRPVAAPSSDSDAGEGSDGVKSSLSFEEEAESSSLSLAVLSLVPAIRFSASSSRSSSTSVRLLFLPRFVGAVCRSDTLEEASDASSSSRWPFVDCSSSDSAIRPLFRWVEVSEGRTGPA